MICEKCALTGKGVEMEEDMAVQNYHDPGDPHGHGQQEVAIWACPDCGLTEERPPEDPPDMDDDS